MFTKPLYASSSGYCIKTSDIPIFKIPLQGKEKTLSFTLTDNGRTYSLSKVARCISRYSDGARQYLLSDDNAWGSWASVEITVCPLTNNNGAIMKFTCKGFSFNAQLSAYIEGQHQKSWFAQEDSYLEIDALGYSCHTQKEMERNFTIARRWNKSNAERIDIATPDPYLNCVMGALLSSIHGSWNKYKWIDGDDYDAITCETGNEYSSEPAKKINLSLAEFMAGSPNRAFDMLKSTLVKQIYKGNSPADMPNDATGVAIRDMVQGLFGIQPDIKNYRCIIRPGLPRQWESASIHTPYLIYKYHKAGSKDIYEITQNFTKPMDIIIRQNIGNGKYRDIIGTNKRHQIISANAFTHDIEDAPAIVVNDDRMSETIETKGYCYEIRIDKFFNHKCTIEHKTTFPVPFRQRNHCYNVAVASSNKGYKVGFDIKTKGKYSCAYLLLTGKSDDKYTNKECGQIIATYSDGSQQTQQIVSFRNWYVKDYEDHCLIKMALDPKKKLKTISLVALVDDIEIGLESLTLEE